MEVGDCEFWPGHVGAPPRKLREVHHESRLCGIVRILVNKKNPACNTSRGPRNPDVVLSMFGAGSPVLEKIDDMGEAVVGTGFTVPELEPPAGKYRPLTLGSSRAWWNVVEFHCMA